MSEANDCSNNIISKFNVDDKQKIATPLWAYVIRDEVPAPGGGGNRGWVCNFCQNHYYGSYTRVKAHLLRLIGVGIDRCPKMNDEYLAEIQKVVECAEESRKPRNVLLPPTSIIDHSFQQSLQHASGNKRRASNPLDRAFNVGGREQLKSEIVRMFYSVGLPFNLARNPYYISSYQFAANNFIAGFIPPGYNSLRTTLLQREMANVERILEPIKGTWSEKGISIVTDGWTDAQRRSLINFMAASDGGPIFLKVIDGSKEIKDKNYIAGLMKSTIEEVGPKKVVQIITDNSPVCKEDGLLIENDYPHIFWTPCVVHTLNLALKNICAARNTEKNEVVYEECHWITLVRNDAMFIRNFVMNHSMRLTIFNEFVTLKLLSIAETRFASTIIMLKRLRLIKHGLQNMVISEKWNTYREDDVGKATHVKAIILDDSWWDKVDYILSFTRPICDMLRLCDTDKLTLHLIYDMWDSMIEQVKTIIFYHERVEEGGTSSFYGVVYQILIDRWTKSCTPLHCLAHSLNPRYYSQQWLQQRPNRVPPHRDHEISTERQKCFRRYFNDPDERREVTREFSKFSGELDEFGHQDSLMDRALLEPKEWWITYGSGASLLQGIAFKLLGQPSSSSCCERNWSVYSFIHSMKRNKVNPKRAEDLVYVHTNFRLLSRKSEKYNSGENKMWDLAGDEWVSFDGAESLEVASLSLDEPELEKQLLSANNE